MNGMFLDVTAARSNAQHIYVQRRIEEQRQQRRANAARRKTSPPSSAQAQRRKTIAHVPTSPTLHEEVDEPVPSLPTEASLVGAAATQNRSEAFHQQLLNNPFELRHGRRYLRDVPYCLPSDLPELQRQNLRTLLACRVFGRAVCAPRVSSDIPQRVLEIGCGTGYWSTMCHDYFCSLGYDDVSFTGLDIAPLAPDLAKHGLNWTFVQHDIRRLPLPFNDEEFDLVMLKDLSLVLPTETVSSPPQRLIAECVRLLRAGGTLEVWETDHCIRSVAMSALVSPDAGPAEDDALARLGVLSVDASTPFVRIHNRFLQQANDWIYEALSQRRLPPAPCARVAQLLLHEGDSLDNLGMEHVAIPLNIEDGHPNQPHYDQRADSPLDKHQMSGLHVPLTAEQVSLRQTALMTVVQLIECLDPILREVSGKSLDEWNHWLSLMSADLSDSSKCSLKGECLVMGAWWASKVDYDVS